MRNYTPSNFFIYMRLKKRESTDMSMQAIRQMNNGGLKLKSNFNMRALANNIGSNRAGAANMLKSSNYSHFGSNALFTKSNPIGRSAKYASSAQISGMVNRPAGQRSAYNAPIGGYATYSQSVNFGNSSAMSAASAIGMILGMAPMLKNSVESLVGNHKTSAGDDLLNKTNLSNTAVTLPVSSDISGTVAAMENATDKASLSEAISSAEQQLGGISNEQSIYDAESAKEQSQLQELQGQTSSLQQAQTDAASEANTMEQTVKTMSKQRDVKQAEADQIDKQYGQAVSEHSKAHDAHTNAISARDGAKSQVELADNNLKEARNNTKSAQNSFNEAKAAYDNCPRTRINPVTQQEEPNEPQLSEARAKMNIAQEKLREAQIKEKDAETCKADADKKLEIAEDNVKSTEKAEAEALKNKDNIAKNLKNKQAEIKKFESELKTKQDNLDAAKGKAERAREKFNAASDALENHQQKMESLNCATKLADAAKANIECLQDSIQTQKNRLNGMPDSSSAPPNSDKNFAKTLVGKGTETTLQVGHDDSPIKGYYGKNPETGNMVYVDQNGNEYTEEAFKNWETLAKTGHLND